MITTIKTIQAADGMLSGNDVNASMVALCDVTEVNITDSNRMLPKYIAHNSNIELKSTTSHSKPQL